MPMVTVQRHHNLRQVQQGLLRDMLTLDGDQFWKVLVMDSFVQRLLSPVLRVADLRDLGVTLHLYTTTIIIIIIIIVLILLC